MLTRFRRDVPVVQAAGAVPCMVELLGVPDLLVVQALLGKVMLAVLAITPQTLWVSAEVAVVEQVPLVLARQVLTRAAKAAMGLLG